MQQPGYQSMRPDITPEKDFLPSKFQTSNTRINNPHSDLEIETAHNEKSFSNGQN